MNKDLCALIQHFQLVKSGKMSPAYREGFLYSYFDSLVPPGATVKEAAAAILRGAASAIPKLAPAAKAVAAPAAARAVSSAGGGGLLMPLAFGAGLAYAPDAIRWGARKLGYGGQGLAGPGLERFGGLGAKEMTDFQRMVARMALVNDQSDTMMRRLRQAMNPGGGGTPFTGA